MFTINQIKETHSKVKSGADFPKYVQEMKALGVTRYEHFLSDGRIQYFGENDFSVSVPAKWELRTIAKTANAKLLKNYIEIHQQGGSDYPTITKQAAEAGVEKWIVDMIKMTCTYFDTTGNEILVENIPSLN